MELFGFESLNVLKNKLAREEKWSRSIAVESRENIENIETKLGVKAIHRKTHESKGSFELREDQIPYTTDFGTENERLSAQRRKSVTG